jgi:RimJ/RimL family protein N-acetyltransferase
MEAGAPPSEGAGLAPRRRITVRPARFRDLGGLVHLYRSQSERSRRFHHPYPFDRPRLAMVLFGMLVAQSFARQLLRWAPNWTFLLFVACPEGTQIVIGYGSIRMVSSRERPVWARFGYLVSEEARAQGIGAQLAVALYRSTLALGVRFGGGTIQRDNLASRKVVERYGFRMTPTEEVDRRAPGVPSLVGIEDLEEVLAHLDRAGRSDAPVGSATAG